MKKHLMFTIEGIRGQGRPRANHKIGFMYEDKKDKEYKEKIKKGYIEALEKSAMPKEGLLFPKGEAVEITLMVRYAIPKSYSKKRKAEIIENREKPLKKPDLDNIAKAVMDALNGVCYADDIQVYSINVNKLYDYNNIYGCDTISIFIDSEI